MVYAILVACWKGIDKQCRPRSDCFWRSSLIRVFHVCYSDNHYVNFSLDNQHFIWKQKEKSIQSFRPLTMFLSHRVTPLFIPACKGIQERDDTMIDVLRFWMLIANWKGLYKQCRPRSDCFWRSSLIRVFSVCYSAKAFDDFRNTGNAYKNSPAFITNIIFEKRKRKVLKILGFLWARYDLGLIWPPYFINLEFALLLSQGLCLFQPAKKSKKEKDEEWTKLRKGYGLQPRKKCIWKCRLLSQVWFGPYLAPIFFQYSYPKGFVYSSQQRNPRKRKMKNEQSYVKKPPWPRVWTSAMSVRRLMVESLM